LADFKESAKGSSVSESLTPFLERLYERYHHPNYLGSDPVEFVHRYSDPWDQESVALLGAVLAYGNVKQIRASVEAALLRMREFEPRGPAAFVRRLGREASRSELWETRQVFEGWVHRFNVGIDLWILWRLLARSWETYGSLGAHFLAGVPEFRTIEAPLDALIRNWLEWEPEARGELPRSDSFFYLLTAPSSGSCCKRWCMFLRWMGRKDSVDPGLWTSAGALASTFSREGRALRSSQLILPLDTHTGRISQYLGLTSRKSLNWKAACEVTSRLQGCDPLDPVKYDFALARLGILDLCQKKYRVEICGACELLPECRFAQRRLKAQRQKALKEAPKGRVSRR
jgi:uncharacterized protein (TIGR02757 family)